MILVLEVEDYDLLLTGFTREGMLYAKPFLFTLLLISRFLAKEVGDYSKKNSKYEWHIFLPAYRFSACG
jgi:hypothetical protein